MATFYLAERASLDIRKLVVLKVFNVALAEHEEMRSAFRREAHLSSRMNHPNVVQVFEVAEHAGQAIIVMEYLDGMPPSRVVRQSTLPLALHLDILLQALDGLHHFHELTDLFARPSIEVVPAAQTPAATPPVLAPRVAPASAASPALAS